MIESGAIRPNMKHHRLTALSAIALLAAPAAAQDRDVPYWASIRSEELNMRVGPSEDFRIAWVYRRQGLPVKVVRLMEGWRLVEDPDGAKGWVVARFLNPDRSALVIGKSPVDMRDAPGGEGRLLWKIAPGNVGMLRDCEDGCCEIAIIGHDAAYTGWIEQTHLWGTDDP